MNKQALRNKLAEEYNYLIRKGDPTTKEHREQLYEQIKELENELDKNSK